MVFFKKIAWVLKALLWKSKVQKYLYSDDEYVTKHVMNFSQIGEVIQSEVART